MGMIVIVKLKNYRWNLDGKVASLSGLTEYWSSQITRVDNVVLVREGYFILPPHSSRGEPVGVEHYGSRPEGQ